jgi:hypothetical protein
VKFFGVFGLCCEAAAGEGITGGGGLDIWFCGG